MLVQGCEHLLVDVIGAGPVGGAPEPVVVRQSVLEQQEAAEVEHDRAEGEGRLLAA